MARTLAPRKAPDKTPQESPWLSDVSPPHAVWDVVKAAADKIAYAYAGSVDLDRYAKRVGDCSEILLLSEHTTPDGHGFKAHAVHCHVRHCPICQRSRAERLRKAIKLAVDKIGKEHPKGRWLFLTLTLEKPEIVYLRAALGDMNKAWQRLTQLKEFSIIQGWLRTTEVTRGAWIDTRTGKVIDKKRQPLESIPAEFRTPKDPTKAHPHFHALLFVPPHYFTGQYYVKQERWVSLWKKSARVDYDPGAYIKAVETVKGGIQEVIKTACYSVKAAEIVDDPAWFLELHRQIHKLRFCATGGIVKEYFDIDAKEDEDLAGQVEGVETGRKLLFDWQRPVKRYRKKSDIPAP
jgi:plasmid rolling circle replication initiator protein Rep